MNIKTKNLISINDLSVNEINEIIDSTDAYKEILKRDIKKVPTLRGKTIITLFYEASTRTRMSFELAAKRMGADVSNIAVATSAVSKGENLKDTIRTLEAMGVDLFIMRHWQSGSPYIAASVAKAGIINAGDGSHEHPTQALLDMYTVKSKKKDFKNLNVAIIGDVYHSRVARSNIIALKRLGANVTLIGPPTLMPPNIEDLGVTISYKLDDIINEFDVLYVLRIQLERQKKGLFPGAQEYMKLYGLNQERLKKAKRNALVMHPGPMNIGLEITEEVANSQNAAIIEQVHNGVAVRMSILNHMLGGRHDESLN